MPSPFVWRQQASDYETVTPFLPEADMLYMVAHTGGRSMTMGVPTLPLSSARPQQQQGWTQSRPLM